MSINYHALGQRIKTIRRKRGLTQQKLSDQIPCSPTYISYVENGSKRLRISLLPRLSVYDNFQFLNQWFV